MSTNYTLPGPAIFEKLYFVGEVKLTSESGQPLGSQVIMVSRIYDSDRSLIVERAIVVKPDGTTDDRLINMRVQGDSFTIDDPQKIVEGSGTLFGTAWHWTYLKGTYKIKNGSIIDDEDFMTTPDVLFSRKKITAPNGQCLMYMDMTLKAITHKTFEILSSAILKKT